MGINTVEVTGYVRNIDNSVVSTTLTLFMNVTRDYKLNAGVNARDIVAGNNWTVYDTNLTTEMLTFTAPNNNMFTFLNVPDFVTI